MRFSAIQEICVPYHLHLIVLLLSEVSCKPLACYLFLIPQMYHPWVRQKSTFPFRPTIARVHGKPDRIDPYCGRGVRLKNLLLHPTSAVYADGSGGGMQEYQANNTNILVEQNSELLYIAQVSKNSSHGYPHTFDFKGIL